MVLIAWPAPTCRLRLCLPSTSCISPQVDLTTRIGACPSCQLHHSFCRELRDVYRMDRKAKNRSSASGGLGRKSARDRAGRHERPFSDLSSEADAPRLSLLRVSLSHLFTALQGPAATKGRFKLNVDTVVAACIDRVQGHQRARGILVHLNRTSR